MMKFDNILIVTDLDDTFLGEKGRLVERNLDAVDYFKKNGGLFTIATGRDHYYVKKPLSEIVKLCNAPLITSNGACIYDPCRDKIERVEPLPCQRVLDIIRQAQKIDPGISCRVSLDDGYVYESEDKIYRYDIGEFRYLTTIAPFDNYLDRQWLKVVFYGERSRVAKITDFLMSLDEPGLHFVNAFIENVEILSKKATKGEKLASLKDYIGNPQLKISAIGDYYNDYEMISLSDIPATVENGAQQLKEIPGVHVCCNNDQGAIADLIEHIEKSVK